MLNFHFRCFLFVHIDCSRAAAVCVRLIQSLAIDFSVDCIFYFALRSPRLARARCSPRRRLTFSHTTVAFLRCQKYFPLSSMQRPPLYVFIIIIVSAVIAIMIGFVFSSLVGNSVRRNRCVRT